MSSHVCGSESCHEQRILMRTSEKGYQVGEGYKTISKEFGLHKSTVRSIHRSILITGAVSLFKFNVNGLLSAR